MSIRAVPVWVMGEAVSAAELAVYAGALDDAFGLNGPVSLADGLAMAENAFIRLPNGSYLLRPVNAPTGGLRYNNTDKIAEVNTPSGWRPFLNAADLDFEFTRRRRLEEDLALGDHTHAGTFSTSLISAQSTAATLSIANRTLLSYTLPVTPGSRTEVFASLERNASFQTGGAFLSVYLDGSPLPLRRGSNSTNSESDILTMASVDGDGLLQLRGRLATGQETTVGTVRMILLQRKRV